MSTNKFVNEGLLLFFDLLIVGAGNWVFWLIISHLSTTSEVGQATIIISLIWLSTSLIQLGLEYPLLKSSDKPRIFVTTLLIEVAIMLTALPFLLYVLNDVSNQSTFDVTVVSIAIFVFMTISFVSRFSLLGISKVRTVLIIDGMATAIKFLAGYILVSMGFGLIGILIPFLLIHLTVTCATLIVAKRSFEFKIGNLSQLKEIIGRGLANAPGKLSRVIILSLTVVLLASFGVNDSAIGVFYISLMISYLAGGALGSSISYMVIPASSKSKVDLSSDSLRIGLSLTVPLIVVLLVAPSQILSIFGPDYSAGGTILFVLSLGIFPFIIMLNAISKLNNLNKLKELIIIGVIQVFTFLITFWLLVPQHETLGAAYSILIAFVVCSIPSLKWLGKKTLRFVSISALAIVLGWVSGFVMYSVFELHTIITVLSSVGISLILVFSLRNISLSEIRQMMKKSRS